MVWKRLYKIIYQDVKVHSLSSGDPHAKIRPIAIFAFYSLNYSLAARLQNNFRPKLPTKVETKRKLQQFTVSGWLIMNGGESGSEKKKTSRLAVTDFFLTHAHPKFVYKLDINNHKTISNEKDMNNLFN